MDLDVQANLTEKELIDILEKEANKMRYTVIEESVEWHPDADDGEPIVTYALDALSDEQKEELDMDPRSPVEQINDRVDLLKSFMDDKLDRLQSKLENLSVESTPQEKPNTGKTDSEDDVSGEEGPDEPVPKWDDPDTAKQRKERLERIREENRSKPPPPSPQPQRPEE